MKERPILFSASMVRAILGGRKTQTRRALKVQPLDILPMQEGKAGVEWVGLMQREPKSKGTVFSCKFGQHGDRLWVRETWQGPILESDEHFDEYRESPDVFKKPGFCVYRATDTLDAVDEDGNELGWRPSIHMPRWASRILLEIVSVRVERLQDIGEADAEAEGCSVPEIIYPDEPRESYSYVAAYRHLWESINGIGSWDANPWVWVIEFKRVQP